MVLCGISSRFQLLSPSIRQVTHALLTRPPLSYKSLGFIITPFDLHVLSTPPAFILSQDQTLIIKVFHLKSDKSGFRNFTVSRFSCSLNFFLPSRPQSGLSGLEFSGMHYCSVIKDLCRHFAATSDILSLLLFHVNNFFQKILNLF